MRLHRVSYGAKQEWFASGSLASKRKTEIMKDTGLNRNSIERDEVDIPTNKTLLLAWLNKNLGERK